MKKHFLILCLALLFAACSSGSGSDDAGTPAGSNTATGVFKDSNVEGLTYTSGSQSGVTNANGEFTYEIGQTVTFSIGGITLGTVAGDEVITPVDLVPNGTTATPAVQNLVRFLMLLDEDADPDNGISISSTMQTAAATWSQVNFETGDLETELSQIITTVAVLTNNQPLSLPDISAAQNHMEKTLRCTYAGAFTGSYTGDDYGNFGIMIDAKTGEAKGLVYSVQSSDLMELRGETPIGYSQNPSFITGTVSGGSTFQGNFSGADAVSGTWQNVSDNASGTYNGFRIGGAIKAKYRYTGQYSGGEYGLFAFDIDADDQITGIAYDIDDNNPMQLTGTLSGNTIDVQVSDDTTATGTLNLSTGEMFGTWYDNEGKSGVFEGCGCRLN